MTFYDLYCIFSFEFNIQINNERRIKTTNSEEMNQKYNEELLTKEIRVTVNISLIVLIFMITWIPVHIQFIVMTFVSGIAKNENIFAVTVTILHFNSIIHPFLYAFRVNSIKKAVCKILGFKGSSQNLISSISQNQSSLL